MLNFHLHFRRGRWRSCIESTAQKLLGFILSLAVFPEQAHVLDISVLNRQLALQPSFLLPCLGKSRMRASRGWAMPMHGTVLPRQHCSREARLTTDTAQETSWKNNSRWRSTEKKTKQTKFFHWFHIACNNSRSHTQEKHLPWSFAGSSTGMACCLS